MENEPRQGEREQVERALEERTDEKPGRSSATAPTEDPLERAFDVEPGVERHAGEDPGGVTDP